MTRCLLSLAALLCVGAGPQGEVPRPAIASTSWELDFIFHDPQRITLIMPGDDKPSTFWYMAYTVQNNTQRDVQFFPTAELVTSSLEVIPAGSMISPSVYDAIRKRHGTTDPFMIEPAKVSGKLLQGEDNARTSIVVFKQFNPNDNAFTIYFSGLSGEIQRIANPSFDPKEGDASERFFTLRKTLAIHYRIPGDPQTRQFATPQRERREWVMR